ncbi:MAG: DNA-protecting protein DprA [Armatimonadetes bacterium]|nr:DNA-protecting protein DprA [Armatimonadota bacterium]
MDRLEWIALAWHAQLGPAAFRRLLDRFGSPRAVCEAGEEELLGCRARLKPEDVERIWSAMEVAPDIAEEIERLEEEGVRVLCPFDEGYPAPLAALRTAPAVLCLAGTWEAARDDPAVAVVGTRSPTEEGADFARELARRFAQQAMTVVSGLARGIDTAAHEGALLGGGRTIAILGSGIRIIHPHENRELAGAIAAQGALISELSPKARPSVRSLMARNRLQSALSKAVIVVESGEQGGSLQTAEDAKRQGRLLYAVDWASDRPEAEGTRQLLAQGALPLRAAEEAPAIVERVRGHVANGPGKGRKPTDEPRQLALF